MSQPGLQTSSRVRTTSDRIILIDTDGDGCVTLTVPPAAPILLTENEALGLSTLLQRAAADA